MVVRYLIILTVFWVPLTAQRSRCLNSCKVSRDINDVHCQCDQKCYFYNDCCRDSPYLKRWVPRRKDLQCFSATDSSESVLTFTECSRSWNGPGIVKQMCEKDVLTLKDPLKVAPVSNTLTGQTYKNNFCAICNGDSDDLQPWKMMLVCPLEVGARYRSLSSARRNVEYNSEKKQWGFKVWNKRLAGEEFLACNGSFRIPEAVEDKVRPCNSKEIASCLPTWRDKKDRKKCSEYRDPVFLNVTAYRNIHCIKCNGLPYYAATCTPGHFVPPTSILEGFNFDRSGNLIPHFGILFDFTTEEKPSNARLARLRAENKCKKNEVYDQFSKKCRRVVCEIPGLIMKGCP